MLCVLCLIVLWGFSLVTSYSGVIGYTLVVMTNIYRILEPAAPLAALQQRGLASAPFSRVYMPQWLPVLPHVQCAAHMLGIGVMCELLFCVLWVFKPQK